MTKRLIYGDDYPGTVFRIGINNNPAVLSIAEDNVTVQTKLTIPDKITGNLDIEGIVTATDYKKWSDIRLKDKISSLGTVLPKLNDINSIYFNYKKDNALGLKTDKKHIGFIAQEVQKDFPELVHEGKEGYLGVDYSSMSAILLQAIKEQQQMINDLNKRLSEKDKENTDYKKQLQILSERVNKLEQK